MSKQPFVHLRVHSEYSINDGIGRINGEVGNIIKRAEQISAPALALTDTENMFGVLKFYNACSERGIKAIIGCEAKIDRGTEEPYHMLFLCANKHGYVNLSRLISRAYAQNDGKIIPDWVDADSAGGLLVLSGSARGLIGRHLMQGRKERASEEAQLWQRKCPNSFYLEVWRNEENDYLCAATADLGRAISLPVVATHPVQCATADDLATLEVRRCIANGWTLNSGDKKPPFADNPYLLSNDEMCKRFADMPGALKNTVEIAKRCNFAFHTGDTYLPQIASDDDHDKILAEKSKSGLGDDLCKRQEYADRLEHELQIIANMGYADYFLIVADFVTWAKNNGIPVGPGRGSGAGSLVSYALGITMLDPIQHNLLFERFLNPERVSMPDFDIDFCVEGRDRVIDYVTKKYGADHVCQIVTFGTIGARGAVRDCGRVLGLPYLKSDTLARMIPHDLDITLEKALERTPAIQETIKTDEEYDRIFNLARQVEGLPRNIGTHAGGVLIAPKPIFEFCPLFTAADSQSLVSQFDMNDVEKVGLVKFDFLGLKTITILHHAEQHLKKNGTLPADFSWESLPLNDKKVFNIFVEANTIGVFQCESAGMRQLMQQLKPDNFNDITALLALFRPGPLNSGMAESYIRRKHGRENIIYPHESTTAALSATYGVFVYQEQVMEVARCLADYTLAKADLLRRAMGKKKPEEMAQQKEFFLTGVNNKMTRNKADNLFDDISKFAGYGFNKSHAAAYALLSYRTAYLKTYYPETLYAAVMSADSGDTERLRLLVGCARRDGITVLSPDINNSECEFRAVANDKIQYGLGAIKGLGNGVVDDIIKARGDKPFSDMFDVCRRLANKPLTRIVLENLITAGAFDSVHPSRASMLAAVPSAINNATENSGNLFGSSSTALTETKPWSKSEILRRESQAIGFCLSTSFYSLYANYLKNAGFYPSQLKNMPDSGSVFIAGSFVKKLTSNKMREKKLEVFLLEDDNNSTVEIRLDSAMAESLHHIKEGQLIIAEGKASKNYFGEIAVSVNSVDDWDSFVAKNATGIAVHCEETTDIAALTAILGQCDGGRAKIFVVYKNGGSDYVIRLGGQWRISASLFEKLHNEVRGVSAVKVEYHNTHA